MKRRLIVLILVLCSVPMVFGSIITNTNQSAQFIRFLARNASTDIDAVYYNPAGLTQLSDGFHLALQNQTFFQEKTVTNAFSFLNSDTFIGKVSAPIFPNFYAVYKKDKFALSFGFGPNAGGGSADYASGLPSFEVPFSQLPAILTAMGVPTTQYTMDISFKGISVFYGFQLNTSFALHETFSIAVGVRYILARNTYEGSLENVMINPTHLLLNPTGNLMSAEQFFTLAGLTDYAAMVADKAVDVKQVGSAFTPLLSANFTPVENLNIGLRYEFNTKLELENQTTTDDTGIYPDGFKFRKDIPAILAVGVEYAVLPQLSAAVSFNMFFDKSANWEGLEEYVDSNSYTVSFGLEYDVSESISFSAGYGISQIGVSDDYQNDLSHELSSSNIGFGGRLKISKNLDLDFGVLIVNYKDAEKTITYTGFGDFTESYKCTTWGFGIGLNFHK